jgi:hypothetical protein
VSEWGHDFKRGGSGVWGGGQEMCDVGASTAGRVGGRLEERGELTSEVRGASGQQRCRGGPAGQRAGARVRREWRRQTGPTGQRERGGRRAGARSYANWAENDRLGGWASFAFSFILKF